MPDQTFLDWPFFEDHHRAHAAKLRDWAEKEIAPLEDEEPHTTKEVDDLTRTFVSKLGEGGWLKFCVPKAYGGAMESFDVRTLALTREILGYYSGLADFAFAMQGLGTGSITLFGSDEQKQAYLPAVATGEKLAAFAISEPPKDLDLQWRHCRSICAVCPDRRRPRSQGALCICG